MPTSTPITSSLRLAALWLCCAATLSATPLRAQSALPAEVEAALARARVPRDAVAMLVVDTEGKAVPRLAHRIGTPVNPASVMKLVTTYAALDQLGPTFNWTTPVYVEGTVRDGVLAGNLYLKGQGDPKLVSERLWLLMRRVQGLGIRSVQGDIVLDRTAFESVEMDPSTFDGEPLRPYNASPDALLVNYKSVVMTFVPDRNAVTAQVQFEPPLAGVQMQPTVPLAAGECGDWRGALKADFSDATRIRFAGSYAASCAEKVWPVAFVDPKSHTARAVEGMWRETGGTLGGKVRDGRVPAGLKPAFELGSPTLAEVIRDINKYSNNVMAQQLFLTLGLQSAAATGGAPVATLESARAFMRAWWKDRFADAEAPLLDNGSGLSRQERITAQSLARVLQAAWGSGVMPELMASLPVTGVDGTLRRMKSRAPAGSAHLKTGSLRDVAGIAGYVDTTGGRRVVLVAIINHANANAARPALEALVDWSRELR